MESCSPFFVFCHIMAVPANITKEWATQALQNFAATLKSTAAGSNTIKVWFVIKHTEKKDDDAGAAVTISDCLCLTRTEETQFWKHFGSKKYLSNMKLHLSETEFAYSKFTGINVVQCR